LSSDSGEGVAPQAADNPGATLITYAASLNALALAVSSVFAADVFAV
jgi:hypothetical protein